MYIKCNFASERPLRPLQCPQRADCVDARRRYICSNPRAQNVRFTYTHLAVKSVVLGGLHRSFAPSLPFSGGGVVVLRTRERCQLPALCDDFDFSTLLFSDARCREMHTRHREGPTARGSRAVSGRKLRMLGVQAAARCRLCQIEAVEPFEPWQLLATSSRSLAGHSSDQHSSYRRRKHLQWSLSAPEHSHALRVGSGIRYRRRIARPGALTPIAKPDCGKQLIATSLAWLDSADGPAPPASLGQHAART